MATRQDEIASLAQNCLAACPVSVLGTGASMPYGIGGMGSLSDYLATNLAASALGTEPPIVELLALLKTKGLEEALTVQRLPEAQEKEVIRLAWQKVQADDCALFERIASGKVKPHLERLFRHLFMSTQRQVHVVTTNYDRLVEYSANSAGFGFSNGFSDGYIGVRSVDEPSRSCRYGCTAPIRSRVVHVWKVHGSLDWFQASDGRTICLPSAPSDLAELEPVIVTPGTSKYQKTHAEPFRTVINESDRALRDAPSLLCVGYGFNDEHIHPKLTERIEKHARPIVVLARSLTEAAKKTILRLTTPTFLAIEQGTSGSSRVFMASCPGGEEVAIPNLWDLGVFLDTYILPTGS